MPTCRHTLVGHTPALPSNCFRFQFSLTLLNPLLRHGLKKEFETREVNDKSNCAERVPKAKIGNIRHLLTTQRVSHSSLDEVEAMLKAYEESEQFNSAGKNRFNPGTSQSTFSIILKEEFRNQLPADLRVSRERGYQKTEENWPPMFHVPKFRTKSVLV
ncbi:hypothetical protein ACTXT7_010406 [Hymenolepis weldensis]